MESNNDEVGMINVIDLFKSEVDMAQDDLLAMEFAIAELYLDRIAKNTVYFGDSPERLKEDNGFILVELNEMNDEFLAKEEYSKCAIIMQVTAVVMNKINSIKSETLSDTSV